MKDEQQLLKETAERLCSYLQKRESSAQRTTEDVIWQNIEAQSALQKRQERHRWLRYAGIAACFLCMAGGYWFLSSVPKTGDNLMEAVAHMSNGTSADTIGEIQLNTSFGDHIRLKANSRQITHKDEAVFVDQRQVLTTDQCQNPSDAPIYNEVIVPRGKHIQLVLSDGSTLNVNACSRVVYPRIFNDEKREIFVEGEIYIDVKPQDEKPFVVRTNHFKVNVTGTAFNVRSYPDDATAEVVLQRGRVEICDDKSQVIPMQPDERVVLADGQYVCKHAVDAAEYVSWTQGLLTFRKERLGKVLHRLTRFYGREISCVPDVANIIISGRLDINEPFEIAVGTVAAAAGLSVVTEEGKLEVR